MKSFLDVDLLQKNNFNRLRSIFSEVDVERILALLSQKFNAKDKDLIKWFDVYRQFPSATSTLIDLQSDSITVGKSSDISLSEEVLRTLLQGVHPWRQGPFDIFGVHIDSEWQSQLKWERLIRHLPPLAGKTILDAGCGNGYYLWRLLGKGAQTVVGIEPILRSVVQFLIVQKYIRSDGAIVLPFSLEELPSTQNGFDLIFSMGVLYHQRNPIAHLSMLKSLLKREGQLILETLVIDQGKEDVLYPAKTYSQMRNVFAVPSIKHLQHWMEEAGLRNIRIVDISTTSPAEQRTTVWSRFQSLADFLDPKDPTRTIEGYTAPTRAIAIATV